MVEGTQDRPGEGNHWSVYDVKCECFSGEERNDLLDQIVPWLRSRPDQVVLFITFESEGDDQVATVFYE